MSGPTPMKYKPMRPKRWSIARPAPNSPSLSIYFETEYGEFGFALSAEDADKLAQALSVRAAEGGAGAKRRPS